MALGLRQLRYFIAIADAGVLSRAAETLNVAQSALSHHVAALETDMGVKLLERRPRGIAADCGWPAALRACQRCAFRTR